MAVPPRLRHGLQLGGDRGRLLDDEVATRPCRCARAQVVAGGNFSQPLAPGELFKASFFMVESMNTGTFQQLDPTVVVTNAFGYVYKCCIDRDMRISVSPGTGWGPGRTAALRWVQAGGGMAGRMADARRPTWPFAALCCCTGEREIPVRPSFHVANKQRSCSLLYPPTS